MIQIIQIKLLELRLFTHKRVTFFKEVFPLRGFDYEYHEKIIRLYACHQSCVSAGRL